MGRRELMEVGGRMNGQRYVEVLRDVLLPTVRVAHPLGQIYLVHDNGAVHRSRLVRDWLSSPDDITFFTRPSKSPDLTQLKTCRVGTWDPSEVPKVKTAIGRRGQQNVGVDLIQ